MPGLPGVVIINVVKQVHRYAPVAGFRVVMYLIDKIVLITYCWAFGYPQKDVCRDFDINKRTFVEWNGTNGFC